MATEAQIKANRQNAKKSTGPRTAKGKRRASKNAVTPGLSIRASCHPDRGAAERRDLAGNVNLARQQARFLDCAALRSK